MLIRTFAPAMKNRLLAFVWITLVFAAVATAANKKFTLVIDAGHGGTDAGAVGSLTKEKHINLNVALAFGRLVERNCPDVRVIYTRKTDVFIPLHTRADIANRNKADLFISIHTNALPKGRISRGLETYTLGMHRAADNLEVAQRENEVILYETDYKQRYQGFDPRSSESYIMFEFMQDRNMAQSVELAKCVQRRTCASADRQNKGVKQAGFLVLRETSMPSCLIELGFISTPDEERFLHSASGVEQLGRGIYQAFVDYRNKYDKNIRVPYKAESSKEKVDIPTVVPQKEQPAPVVVPQKVEPAPVVVQQDTVKTVVETPQPTVPVVQQDTVKVQAPAPVSAPVFKLQILTSSSRLKATDARLKGESSATYYEEGGLYKYTVGASEDYNEISRLRKTLLEKFPQAFIVSFKDGKKMDVREAIRDFKNRRNK
jgi:N-acetylmuramoyl-L-alanine amidase